VKDNTNNTNWRDQNIYSIYSKKSIYSELSVTVQIGVFELLNVFDGLEETIVFFLMLV